MLTTADYIKFFGVILSVIAIIVMIVLRSRKKANDILKIKYQWHPWHQVWYYMVTIKDLDMEMPGIQLSSNKEGTGLVEIYSFRDYSLRGAADSFRQKVLQYTMEEQLFKKTAKKTI